nr:unnamed protein product [Callosobruchus analis]
MATVNAKYHFTYIDVGTNGRISDGGVLQNTNFFQKLENSELKSSEILGSGNKDSLYGYIANDAFPLRPDTMKPWQAH